MTVDDDDAAFASTSQSDWSLFFPERQCPPRYPTLQYTTAKLRYSVRQRTALRQAICRDYGNMRSGPEQAVKRQEGESQSLCGPRETTPAARTERIEAEKRENGQGERAADTTKQPTPYTARERTRGCGGRHRRAHQGPTRAEKREEGGGRGEEDALSKRTVRSKLRIGSGIISQRGQATPRTDNCRAACGQAQRSGWHWPPAAVRESGTCARWAPTHQFEIRTLQIERGKERGGREGTLYRAPRANLTARPSGRRSS